VIAGKIVQMVSTSCASRIFRHEYLFIIRASIAYPTKVITIVNTNIAWSWKPINIDIMGEAAS
jgi:hypothetical protein